MLSFKLYKIKVILAMQVLLLSLLKAQTISAIAGNGTQGFSGDNSSATAAQLYYPYAITVDNSGNLYIAYE